MMILPGNWNGCGFRIRHLRPVKESKPGGEYRTRDQVVGKDQWWGTDKLQKTELSKCLCLNIHRETLSIFLILAVLNIFLRTFYSPLLASFLFQFFFLYKRLYICLLLISYSKWSRLSYRIYMYLSRYDFWSDRYENIAGF